MKTATVVIVVVILLVLVVLAFFVLRGSSSSGFLGAAPEPRSTNAWDFAGTLAENFDDIFGTVRGAFGGGGDESVSGSAGSKENLAALRSMGLVS